MTQMKVLIHGNPVKMGFEIQELVREGWEIDPDYPLDHLGFGLECRMIRDPDAAQLAADAAKPLSRAEILAKAREAKANKKKEQENV